MDKPKPLTDEEKYILTLPFDFEYYCKLRERFEAGVCGFCDIDRSIDKVKFENEHWLIWENSFKNTRACKTMLIIVARDHWRSLGDITDNNAWESFGEMIQWAGKNYDIPGGILFLRFGPMSSNAGTMPHLHWNIWVPDSSVKGDARKVWIPVQKTEAEEKADAVRTDGFAKRFKSGERA